MLRLAGVLTIFFQIINNALACDYGIIRKQGDTAVFVITVVIFILDLFLVHFLRLLPLNAPTSLF